MRKDQAEKLDELSESLMDVFAQEADPKNWTGAELAQVDMTPDIRGARNWDIKNANQAGALLARVLDLRDRVNGKDGSPPPPDDAADADISKYEKQARTILKTMSERQSGRA